MRGILIDPFARTVTEADYNGDFHHIYTLIGCDTFTVLEVGGGNTLFLDDEGLFKDLAQQAFFGLKGYGQPLAGKGLILATDSEGETIATRLTIEQVQRKVIWLTPDAAKRHGEAGGFDGKFIADDGTVTPLPIGPLTDSREDELDQARREAAEAHKATEVAKAAMEAVRGQAKKVIDQLNKAIEESEDDDDEDD